MGAAFVKGCNASHHPFLDLDLLSGVVGNCLVFNNAVGNLLAGATLTR
jgi:hypothetical protein